MSQSAYSKVTPEEFLDHEGIEYRKTSGTRGKQLNVKTCPSCGGDEWKVYLSEETGYGNCFHGSCGVGYNLWTFAKAHLDTSDSSAIHKVFEDIAISGGWKPVRKAPTPQAPPPFEGALKLPNSLPIPDQNIDYLKDRGIPVDVSRLFGLQICWNGAYKFMTEDGRQAMTSFSDRVIIPVYNLDGKLVTFQGRDITGKADKKYLFPSRLPGTARFLYNGHRALIRRARHIVMAEGAFDVIAVHMAISGHDEFADTEVVGSFGKKLTLDPDAGAQTQLQELLRLKRVGCERITILWDGEAAALSSAAEAAKALKSYGFDVRIGLLPPGKDPAESAPETVRKSIRKSVIYTRGLGFKIKINNPYLKLG